MRPDESKEDGDDDDTDNRRPFFLNIQNDFKRNLWIACCEFVTSPSYGSYFYILAIIKCHRAQKKNANSPPLLYKMISNGIYGLLVVNS